MPVSTISPLEQFPLQGVINKSHAHGNAVRKSVPRAGGALVPGRGVSLECLSH